MFISSKQHHYNNTAPQIRPSSNVANFRTKTLCSSRYEFGRNVKEEHRHCRMKSAKTLMDFSEEAERTKIMQNDAGHDYHFTQNFITPLYTQNGDVVN